MREISKRSIRLATICAFLVGSQEASAVAFVWDIPNFIVNKINMKNNEAYINKDLKANKKREKQLEAIRYQLATNKEGTVNHYTSISADIDQTNIDIDADFTWIVNEGGGNEIIPIPSPVKDFMGKVMGEKNVEDFAAQYRSAHDYKEGKFDAEAGFEGSRARKAANDMWIKSIDGHQANLKTDAMSLKDLMDKNKDKKNMMGHGHQLQIANAIAQSQVNQLIQLRSMMLVSEAARLAESQAAADREARALVASARLREGLEQASSNLAKPIKAGLVEAF